MRFLIGLITLFISLGSFAQHYLGLQGGWSHAQVQRKGYEYYEPSDGLTFGGFYQYRLEQFTAKSVLGFQQKGYSQALIFVDEAGNVLGEGDIETNRFRYMYFSQLVGVNFGDKLNFSFLVGPSEYLYLGTHVTLDDVTLDNGDLLPGYNLRVNNLTRFDLSATVELGLSYEFNEHNIVQLIANYNHGLTRVGFSTYPELERFRNHTFTVQVGFRRHLRD